MKKKFHPDKRRFLRTALSGLGLGTIALQPAVIQRALAIEAHSPTGTIQDVQHVVILMQENRSFDMYFGCYRGVRGFGDRITIPLPDKRRVWEQYNGSRVVLPYHLDSNTGNAQRVAGTPHAYLDAQLAWDHGRMCEWPRHKRDHSMGYYKEAELPFQYALADAFTLCDAYHCSAHGGTNMNRLFHWTGTNDPSGKHGGPVTDNQWDQLGNDKTGWGWKTYPERLEENGITWKVYQNLPDNYTDNPLAGFKQFRTANLKAGNRSNGAPYTAWDPSHNARNPLYKGVANTMADGGFLASLRDDVLRGQLPQVSWIIAPQAYSEHADPSSPVQGAWYTQEVLSAITASPEVWSKTVLLINFDENDGFFDHVPPPAPPSMLSTGGFAGDSTVETDQDRHMRRSKAHKVDHRVYGAGPRVPLYVVSPWSRGGWVNSQAFDHTSVLRFLEMRFGVREDNISPWRRAVMGDLSSAFNFATPNHAGLPQIALLTRPIVDQTREQQEVMPKVAIPNAGQLWRHQQALGARRSRALPYELHTNCHVDLATPELTLHFANSGNVGAVFHVYDQHHLEREPRRYTVEPGKSLAGVWSIAADEGRYDLWVMSHNGYLRHFVGDAIAARKIHVDAEIRVCYDIANGDIFVRCTNLGKQGCTVVAMPVAYYDDSVSQTLQLAPETQGQMQWALAASGAWYDFQLRIQEEPRFSRRFAGRVETGRDGISDPAMGL